MMHKRCPCLLWKYKVEKDYILLTRHVIRCKIIRCFRLVVFKIYGISFEIFDEAWKGSFVFQQCVLAEQDHAKTQAQVPFFFLFGF